MNKYKILSRNSNGNFSHFKTVTLKNDEKADEVVNNLEENTGFDYKWKFVESVEDGEVVIESEEEGSEEEDTTTEETPTLETVTTEEDGEEFDFVEDADQDEYPRGWHLRKEFVDKEGTVYQRGEEQPDLYRTKEPSEY